MNPADLPQVEASISSMRKPQGCGRLHFNIRWMLLAFAVFGIYLYRVRERMLVEQEAEALYAQGWKLEQLADGARLSGNLRVAGGPASSDVALSQVVRVADQKGVVELWLRGNLHSSLFDLQGLKKLKRLSLGGWEIQRNDVEEISRLPNLEALQLCDFGADALAPLQNSRRLTYLALNSAPSGSFRSLSKIPQLRWLGFYCEGRDRDRMAQQLDDVAQCQQLEILTLFRNGPTSDQLKPLQHATKLRMLALDFDGGPDVYDALAGIRTLRVLGLWSELDGIFPPKQIHAPLHERRPDIQFLHRWEDLPRNPIQELP